MIHLGILISDNGSNMVSILKAIKKKKIPINPAIVISNKANAKGLSTARKMGVKTILVESKNQSRAQYDKKVMATLMEYGVTPRNGLVCLAGFMRIISPQFVKRYKNRIINIHPSLLPAFPGIFSQRQALEYGVKYTGCTVHFVDAGIDTGPIILQAVIKIKKGDTVMSLSQRILKEEHLIYPKAVELFARKKIKIFGRKATIL